MRWFEAYPGFGGAINYYKDETRYSVELENFSRSSHHCLRHHLAPSFALSVSQPPDADISVCACDLLPSHNATDFGRSKLLGTIPLSDATVRPMPNPDQETWLFAVVTSKRVWEFAALSAQARERWMTVLGSVILQFSYLFGGTSTMLGLHSSANDIKGRLVCLDF